MAFVSTFLFFFTLRISDAYEIFLLTSRYKQHSAVGSFLWCLFAIFCYILLLIFTLYFFMKAPILINISFLYILKSNTWTVQNRLFQNCMCIFWCKNFIAYSVIVSRINSTSYKLPFPVQISYSVIAMITSCLLQTNKRDDSERTILQLKTHNKWAKLFSI